MIEKYSTKTCKTQLKKDAKISFAALFWDNSYTNCKKGDFHHCVDQFINSR